MNVHFQRRLTSALLIILMLLSQVLSEPVYAQAQDAPKNAGVLRLSSLQVPANLGRIEKSYQGSKPGQIILIQDAHAIPDAQQAIRKLIRFFEDKYGVQTVALEGASEELDPQFLKSFPDKKILKQVFGALHEKGELAGGAAAAIFNPASARYVGIEDWDLYESGAALYLNAESRQAALLEKIGTVKNKIETRQQEVNSKKLQELNAALDRFYKDRKGLTAVFEKLAAHQKPDPDSDLGLLYSKIHQDPARQEKAVQEVKKIASDLERRLKLPAQNTKLQAEFHKQYQLFLTGQSSPENFANFLKPLLKSAKLKTSKSFDDLAAHESRIQNIQGTEFFSQFETYAAQVKEKLYENDEQRALDFHKSRLNLLERFAKLELSHQDWQAIQDWRAGKPVLIKNGIRLPQDSAPLEQIENGFLESMAECFGFYENALHRDRVLFANLQKLVSSSQNVIFVGGGFHSEGLTRLLREQGISYTLLMPEMKSIPEQSPYLSHMKGDVSWKNYLKPAGNGRVPLYGAFMRAMRDQLLSAGVGLKVWRDQIIRDLSKQNRLDQAAKYTSLLDETVPGAAKQSPVLADARKFVESLRLLVQKNEYTPQNIGGLLKPSASIGLFDGTALLQPGSTSFNPYSAAPRAEIRTLDEFLKELESAKETDANGPAKIQTLMGFPFKELLRQNGTQENLKKIAAALAAKLNAIQSFDDNALKMRMILTTNIEFLREKMAMNHQEDDFAPLYKAIFNQLIILNPEELNDPRLSPLRKEISLFVKTTSLAGPFPLQSAPEITEQLLKHLIEIYPYSSSYNTELVELIRRHIEDMRQTHAAQSFGSIVDLVITLQKKVQGKTSSEDYYFRNNIAFMLDRLSTELPDDKLGPVIECLVAMLSAVRILTPEENKGVRAIPASMIVSALAYLSPRISPNDLLPASQEVLRVVELIAPQEDLHDEQLYYVENWAKIEISRYGYDLSSPLGQTMEKFLIKIAIDKDSRFNPTEVQRFRENILIPGRTFSEKTLSERLAIYQRMIEARDSRTLSARPLEDGEILTRALDSSAAPRSEMRMAKMFGKLSRAAAQDSLESDEELGDLLTPLSAMILLYLGTEDKKTAIGLLIDIAGKIRGNGKYAAGVRSYIDEILGAEMLDRQSPFRNLIYQKLIEVEGNDDDANYTRGIYAAALNRWEGGVIKLGINAQQEFVNLFVSIPGNGPAANKARGEISRLIKQIPLTGSGIDFFRGDVFTRFLERLDETKAGGQYPYLTRTFAVKVIEQNFERATKEQQIKAIQTLSSQFEDAELEEATLLLFADSLISMLKKTGEIDDETLSQLTASTVKSMKKTYLETRKITAKLLLAIEYKRYPDFEALKQYEPEMLEILMIGKDDVSHIDKVWTKFRAEIVEPAKGQTKETMLQRIQILKAQVTAVRSEASAAPQLGGDELYLMLNQPFALRAEIRVREYLNAAIEEIKSSKPADETSWRTLKIILEGYLKNRLVNPSRQDFIEAMEAFSEGLDTIEGGDETAIRMREILLSGFNILLGRVSIEREIDTESILALLFKQFDFIKSGQAGQAPYASLESEILIGLGRLDLLMRGRAKRDPTYALLQYLQRVQPYVPLTRIEKILATASNMSTSSALLQPEILDENLSLKIQSLIKINDQIRDSSELADKARSLVSGMLNDLSERASGDQLISLLRIFLTNLKLSKVHRVEIELNAKRLTNKDKNTLEGLTKIAPRLPKENLPEISQAIMTKLELLSSDREIFGAPFGTALASAELSAYGYDVSSQASQTVMELLAEAVQNEGFDNEALRSFREEVLAPGKTLSETDLLKRIENYKTSFEGRFTRTDTSMSVDFNVNDELYFASLGLGTSFAGSRAEIRTKRRADPVLGKLIVTFKAFSDFKNKKAMLQMVEEIEANTFRANQHQLANLGAIVVPFILRVNSMTPESERIRKSLGNILNTVAYEYLSPEFLESVSNAASNFKKINRVANANREIFVNALEAGPIAQYTPPNLEETIQAFLTIKGDSAEELTARGQYAAMLESSNGKSIDRAELESLMEVFKTTQGSGLAINRILGFIAEYLTANFDLLSVEEQKILAAVAAARLRSIEPSGESWPNRTRKSLAIFLLKAVKNNSFDPQESESIIQSAIEAIKNTEGEPTQREITRKQLARLLMLSEFKFHDYGFDAKRYDESLMRILLAQSKDGQSAITPDLFQKLRGEVLATAAGKDRTFILKKMENFMKLLEAERPAVGQSPSLKESREEIFLAGSRAEIRIVGPKFEELKEVAGQIMGQRDAMPALAQQRRIKTLLTEIFDEHNELIREGFYNPQTLEAGDVVMMDLPLGARYPMGVAAVVLGKSPSPQFASRYLIIDSQGNYTDIEPEQLADQFDFIVRPRAEIRIEQGDVAALIGRLEAFSDFENLDALKQIAVEAGTQVGFTSQKNQIQIANLFLGFVPRLTGMDPETQNIRDAVREIIGYVYDRHMDKKFKKAVFETAVNLEISEVGNANRQILIPLLSAGPDQWDQSSSRRELLKAFFDANGQTPEQTTARGQFAHLLSASENKTVKTKELLELVEILKNTVGPGDANNHVRSFIASFVRLNLDRFSAEQQKALVPLAVQQLKSIERSSKDTPNGARDSIALLLLSLLKNHSFDADTGEQIIQAIIEALVNTELEFAPSHTAQSRLVQLLLQAEFKFHDYGYDWKRFEGSFTKTLATSRDQKSLLTPALYQKFREEVLAPAAGKDRRFVVKRVENFIKLLEGERPAGAQPSSFQNSAEEIFLASRSEIRTAMSELAKNVTEVFREMNGKEFKDNAGRIFKAEVKAEQAVVGADIAVKMVPQNAEGVKEHNWHFEIMPKGTLQLKNLSGIDSEVESGLLTKLISSVANSQTVQGDLSFTIYVDDPDALARFIRMFLDKNPDLPSRDFWENKLQEYHQSSNKANNVPFLKFYLSDIYSQIQANPIKNLEDDDFDNQPIAALLDAFGRDYEFEAFLQDGRPSVTVSVRHGNRSKLIHDLRNDVGALSMPMTLIMMMNGENDAKAFNEKLGGYAPGLSKLVEDIRQPDLNSMKAVMAFIKRINELFSVKNRKIVETRIKQFEKPEIMEFIGKMNKTAAKIYRDTNDLLLGQSEEAEEVFVNELIHDLSSQSGDTQVQITFDDPEEIFATIKPREFMSVVTNLVKNAVEATQSKGAQGNVHLTLKTEGEYFVLKVRDNGAGMTSEMADLIFSGRAKSTKGTVGIGLNTSRDHILNSDGYWLRPVSVLETTEAMGSTEFTFMLPINPESVMTANENKNLFSMDVKLFKQDFSQKAVDPAMIKKYKGNNGQLQYYIDYFGARASNKNAKDLYGILAPIVPAEFEWTPLDIGLDDVLKLKKDFQQKKKDAAWVSSHVGDLNQVVYYLEGLGDRALSLNAADLFTAIENKLRLPQGESEGPLLLDALQWSKMDRTVQEAARNFGLRAEIRTISRLSNETKSYLGSEFAAAGQRLPQLKPSDAFNVLGDFIADRFTGTALDEQMHYIKFLYLNVMVSFEQMEAALRYQGNDETLAEALRQLNQMIGGEFPPDYESLEELVRNYKNRLLEIQRDLKFWIYGQEVTTYRFKPEFSAWKAHSFFNPAIFPDGERVAGYDFNTGEIRIINRKTDQVLRTLYTVDPRGVPVEFRVSPAGRYLVTQESAGRNMRLWDTTTGELLRHYVSESSFDFADDETKFAIYRRSANHIEIFDLNTRQSIYLPQRQPVLSIALDKEGRNLLTIAPQPRAIQIRETRPEGEVRELPQTVTWGVRAADFLPDGRLLFLSSGQIRIFNPQTNEISGPLLRVYGSGDAHLTAGRLVYTDSSGVKILDPVTGEEWTSLIDGKFNSPFKYSQVQFSLDEKQFYLGNNTGIWRWDLSALKIEKYESLVRPEIRMEQESEAVKAAQDFKRWYQNRDEVSSKAVARDFASVTQEQFEAFAAAFLEELEKLEVPAEVNAEFAAASKGFIAMIAGIAKEMTAKDGAVKLVLGVPEQGNEAAQTDFARTQADAIRKLGASNLEEVLVDGKIGQILQASLEKAGIAKGRLRPVRDLSKIQVDFKNQAGLPRISDADAAPSKAAKNLLPILLDRTGAANADIFTVSAAVFLQYFIAYTAAKELTAEEFSVLVSAANKQTVNAAKVREISDKLLKILAKTGYDFAELVNMQQGAPSIMVNQVRAFIQAHQAELAAASAA